MSKAISAGTGQPGVQAENKQRLQHRHTHTHTQSAGRKMTQVVVVGKRACVGKQGSRGLKEVQELPTAGIHVCIQTHL